MTKSRVSHNWTYQDEDMDKILQCIRSGTLRTLVVIYERWKGQSHPFGIDLGPDAEWIMNLVHCSKRTAYDYKNTIEFILGLKDLILFGRTMKKRENKQ